MLKTTLITKLCKGKEIKNIIDEVDIKGKEIKFVDSERADDFFDIFGLEQNDVDEEEDEMFDMSDVPFW